MESSDYFTPLSQEFADNVDPKLKYNKVLSDLSETDDEVFYANPIFLLTSIN